MPVVNHGIFSARWFIRNPLLLNFIVKAPIVRYCLDQVIEIGTVNIGDPLVCLLKQNHIECELCQNP